MSYLHIVHCDSLGVADGQDEIVIMSNGQDENFCVLNGHGEWELKMADKSGQLLNALVRVTVKNYQGESVIVADGHGEIDTLGKLQMAKIRKQ